MDPTRLRAADRGSTLGPTRLRAADHGPTLDPARQRAAGAARSCAPGAPRVLACALACLRACVRARVRSCGRVGAGVLVLRAGLCACVRVGACLRVGTGGRSGCALWCRRGCSSSCGLGVSGGGSGGSSCSSCVFASGSRSAAQRQQHRQLIVRRSLPHRGPVLPYCLLWQTTALRRPAPTPCCPVARSIGTSALSRQVAYGRHWMAGCHERACAGTGGFLRGALPQPTAGGGMGGCACGQRSALGGCQPTPRYGPWAHGGCAWACGRLAAPWRCFLSRAAPWSWRRGLVVA